MLGQSETNESVVFVLNLTSIKSCTANHQTGWVSLRQMNVVFVLKTTSIRSCTTDLPSDSVGQLNKWIFCVYHYPFLFFFFCVPYYTSAVHHFCVRFLHMWPFLNPTIEVVTFHLHGLCKLGVFCSPFYDMNVTIFGVRAMECMSAQARPPFNFLPKEFWGNGVRTHVNS